MKATMATRTYYLHTDGHWYMHQDGRWQFIGPMPEVQPLSQVVKHNSDMISVTKLSRDQIDLLRQARNDLQFEEGQLWELCYVEAG